MLYTWVRLLVLCTAFLGTLAVVALWLRDILSGATGRRLGAAAESALRFRTLTRLGVGPIRPLSTILVVASGMTMMLSRYDGRWSACHIPVILFLLLDTTVWQRRSRLKWLAVLREEDFRICPDCAYFLKGSLSERRCPECGRVFTERELRRTWERILDLDDAHSNT